jgi:GNAT superfamily N-acetyltransferase
LKSYKHALLYLGKSKRDMELVTKLELNLVKKMFDMRILLSSVTKANEVDGINFVIFKKGLDEVKRVIIQNAIFSDTKGHIDCDIDDILYEESQDYFLEDGGIFLYVNKDIAGYSQIILEKQLNNKPYIVNFGIHRKYRHKGLAKQLLTHTLNSIKKMGFNEAYLSVDSDNFKAYNMYKKMGFKKINTLSCYQYEY